MTSNVIRFPVERRADPASPPSQATPAAWATQAHGVLDVAERLLAEQPADVVELCRRSFEVLGAAAGDIDDDEGLIEVARRLGALHRHACERAGTDAADIVEWLTEAWRTCASLTRHFVEATDHRAGGGSHGHSPAVSAARRRHPSRRAHRSRTAG